ncbi:MAG: S41 family peptidase [Armatimonadota bacterium]
MKRAFVPVVLALVVLGSFAVGRLLRSLWPSEGLLLARFSANGGDGLAHVGVFKTVLDVLDKEYYDKISDKRKLSYGAVENMIASLNDPYSEFLTPERCKALYDAERGIFHGLGAVVVRRPARYKNLDYMQVAIAAVVPGGAAHKAGLQSGDVIVRVNDSYVFDLPANVDLDSVDEETIISLLSLPRQGRQTVPQFVSYREVMDILSRDGSQVRLVVKRFGESKPIEVKLTLAEVKVPAVEWRVLKGNIGYLKINGFTAGCGEEVGKALSEFRSRGCGAVVVDLRDNFGGSVDEMRAVASKLMAGAVGYVHRKGEPRKLLSVESEEPVFSGRIAVLVNQGTMGTAELLASALKERKIGVLVGTRTFGDGLEQALVPLEDGSAIKLTVGKFLTASGRDFGGRGIEPSYLVSGADRQLVKALEVVSRPSA